MVSLPVERLMLYPAVGLDKQHVHHNQSFVHMLTAHTFRKRWNKARAALKFPASYQFYSLKDTGLRDLIAKEGVIVARDQARHTDVSTTNKYLVSKSLTVHDEAKHYDGAL